MIESIVCNLFAEGGKYPREIIKFLAILAFATKGLGVLFGISSLVAFRQGSTRALLIWLSALLFGGLIYVSAAAFGNELKACIPYGRISLSFAHAQQFVVWGLATAPFAWGIWKVAGKRFSRIDDAVTGKAPESDDTIPDTLNIEQSIPVSPGNFNPRKYIRSPDKEVFFGLRKKKFLGIPYRERVCMPLDEFQNGHVKISGPTRTGKGLFTQTQIVQALDRGEGVVFIDPKGDYWAPAVLFDYCSKNGLPYYFLDAGSCIPQWHPTFGKDRNETLALFSTGFNLKDRGDKSDYYQAKNRSLARLIASDSNLRSLPWPILVSKLESEYPDDVAEAEGFMDALKEYSDEPFIQTAGGINLSSALEEGGVIYVTGNPMSEVNMRLLKLFALSVLQTALNRPGVENRRICLVLDEFKELMCAHTVQCLSLAAGSGVQAFVMHQAQGDLQQDVDSQSAHAVANTIEMNASTRVVFRTPDPDSADYFSRACGTTITKQHSRGYERDGFLNQSKTWHSTFTDVETPVIHPNTLRSLPDRCAALLTRGKPELFFVSPVPVEPKRGFDELSWFPGVLDLDDIEDVVNIFRRI